eukprot:1440634-Alexandrium_andersonii.AAC.1
MSASLVGSEMCIRDRSLPGSPRASRTPRRAAPCPSADPRAVVALRALSAVSYTHLTLPTICSV